MWIRALLTEFQIVHDSIVSQFPEKTWAQKQHQTKYGKIDQKASDSFS